MKSPIIILAGPTASGKSALAIELAQKLGGEIVNADSMQIYRDLSILTARPDATDCAKVPHHLFGTLPASTRCSVGQWLDMVTTVIKDIRQRNQIPVVVGGTGLYLKALTDGLAAVPDIPGEVQQHAQQHYEKIGGQAFIEELAQLDAVSASRLPANDVQRLVRAYAVVKATGRPLTDWHKDQSPGPAVEASFITLTLIPERKKLYQAIDKRFDRMIERGALDEVRALSALQLDPSLPAMKALGVPQLIACLKTEDDDAALDFAIEKSAQLSRNYAKRQLTWLRHQIKSDFQLIPPLSQAQKDALMRQVSDKICHIQASH